ncbi:MAG TPA: DNA primase [Gemmatimonadaceae bacterium]|nr:DNA primase [Gemmatimonadaceae bacterium]
MAGFIPPEKLEQIRAASDIVDVIGAAIPLKRAGANFVALCPFHREKSPSFNVNPHRQIFHCFGCHKGGDVFAFLRDYENLSFIDAVKRLAERANIPLEFENQPGQRESRALKDTLLQMHEQIARRWQTALANDPAGQIARDYLAKRGVSPEAVELFRLGFAPDAWDDTVNWSKSKEYDLAHVEQAGLIIRKEGTDRFYDRFRGRLMFPICDEQGRVVAFSGRVLSDDEKTAKYVNSPETPIFTKGKVLYALDKAKRAILDLGFVVVCEGQLDTIACHSNEMRAVVAPQGTALTAAHARILRRFTEDIILCFDGDAAGQRAATRAFEELISSGVSFRVASIPPPDDPDSYVKKFGRDAFAKLIRGADDFFEFYLKYLCSVHDVRTDRGRVSITQSMSEVLKPTYRDVIIDTYAQKTAQRLGVDPEAVRAEFKKRGRAKPAFERPDAPEEPQATPAEPPPSEREFWLLRYLLLHDEQMDWVAQHLDLGWLEHPTLKKILAARLAAHASQHWRGIPSLIDELNDPTSSALITKAAAEDSPKGDLGRGIVDNIRMFRDDYLDRQLAKLQLRLSQPELSAGEMDQIVREQAELRRAQEQPFG